MWILYWYPECVYGMVFWALPGLAVSSMEYKLADVYVLFWLVIVACWLSLYSCIFLLVP